MPLAFDPSETFPVSLASDAAKPEASRPAFRFHYLSSRGYRVRMALLEEWNAYYAQPLGQRTAVAYERLIVRTYEALGDQCAGWENICQEPGVDGDAQIPFAASELDSILTDAEARELLDASAHMSRLRVEEKKDSGSPSSGEPAKSVPADAIPAAPDSPQPTTGSPSSVPPAPAAIPSAPSAAGKTGS